MAQWAKNVLGLIVVLSLLIMTIAITFWSFWVYRRSLRETGRAVPIRGQTTSTRWAQSLFATSYRRVNRRKLVAFKLRTETHCGPLLCRMNGDPFVRSQRMVLVFITLLSGLFFSTLFFQIPMEPVCLDPADESTCKSYRCPSCYELHGVPDCSDALPSPTEICANYGGTASSAHAVCETRPLSLCRLRGGLRYVDPVDGFCAAGVYIKVDEHYAQAGTGDLVYSHCVEHEVSLGQTVLSSLFATACTLPVMSLLSALFNRLREPEKRAIEGEYHAPTSVQHLDYDCYIITKAYRYMCCKQQAHVSPERLQTEAPHRLQRAGLGAAVPYISALSVGIACTVLLALVVITFNAATTKLWLVSSMMSVLTTWAVDPFKMFLVTMATSQLKCGPHSHNLREASTAARGSLRLRKVARMVRLGTRIDLAIHDHDRDHEQEQSGLTVEDLDGDDVVDPPHHYFHTLKPCLGSRY